MNLVLGAILTPMEGGYGNQVNAGVQLIFLVLRDVAKDWKMPAREWTEAKSQFAILFEERFKIA